MISASSLVTWSRLGSCRADRFGFPTGQPDFATQLPKSLTHSDGLDRLRKDLANFGFDPAAMAKGKSLQRPVDVVRDIGDVKGSHDRSAILARRPHRVAGPP